MNEMLIFFFNQLIIVCTLFNSTAISSVNVVLQEVSPRVIITSAKQEHCMTRFLQQLGEFWGTNILKWDRQKTSTWEETKSKVGRGNKVRLWMLDTAVSQLDKEGRVSLPSIMHCLILLSLNTSLQCETTTCCYTFPLFLRFTSWLQTRSGYLSLLWLW